MVILTVAILTMARLEEQMDHVSSTMGVLKGKMKQMASSKDRGKYCAIMWLSVLLFILIMLAVET